MPLTVAAFYQFTPIADPASLRGRLVRAAGGAGVKGTILLAPEGINGTIAGSREAVQAVLAAIRDLPGCKDLDWKEAEAARRRRKRIKQMEIPR